MNSTATYRIGCIVMAAGNAARFGENKLAAVVNGKSLIHRALETVPTERVTETVVVTQYRAVEQLALQFGFTVLQNAHPDWGISHTIRLGTEFLRDRCDALLYLVSDQPMLTRASVAAAIDRYREVPDRIVALAHGGVRGNPCIFPARFFPELMALQEDHGGNTVIRRHESDLVLVEVPSVELEDVDTPAALQHMTGDTEV